MRNLVVVLSALLAWVLVAGAADPAAVADHILILHDSETAKLADALAVMKESGVDEKTARPILEAVSSRGQAVAAQGPRVAMERVAARFAAIGMKSVVQSKVEAVTSRSEYVGSDVTDVTSIQQLEELMKGSGGTLVKFYGNSCAHCKQMVPEYKSAATALKGSLRVAACNLQAVEGGAELAQRLGIRTLPTIRFIINGDHIEHSGARVAADLVEFARKAAADAAPAAQTAEPAESSGSAGAVGIERAAGDGEGAESPSAATDAAVAATDAGASRAAAHISAASKGTDPSPSTVESKQTKLGQSKFLERQQAPEQAPAAAAA